MCDRSSGVLVPCRAALLHYARERVRAVQPLLFPLGLDPHDVRPEVTAWDPRRPTEAGTLPALTGANESVSICWQLTEVFRDISSQVSCVPSRGVEPALRYRAVAVREEDDG